MNNGKLNSLILTITSELNNKLLTSSNLLIHKVCGSPKVSGYSTIVHTTDVDVSY